MSSRNTLVLVLVVAAISAAVTRFYFPQIEFKNTETVKEVVRNDIKIIERVIERPDGTKEIIKETTDKSTKKETSTSETIIAAKKQWLIAVGANTKLSSRDLIVYDLHVQRRILGPFYLGAKVATDKSVGVSLGMEF